MKCHNNLTNQTKQAIMNQEQTMLNPQSFTNSYYDQVAKVFTIILRSNCGYYMSIEEDECKDQWVNTDNYCVTLDADKNYTYKCVVVNINKCYGVDHSIPSYIYTAMDDIDKLKLSIPELILFHKWKLGAISFITSDNESEKMINGFMFRQYFNRQYASGVVYYYTTNFETKLYAFLEDQRIKRSQQDKVNEVEKRLIREHLKFNIKDLTVEQKQTAVLKSISTSFEEAINSNIHLCTSYHCDGKTSFEYHFFLRTKRWNVLSDGLKKKVCDMGCKVVYQSPNPEGLTFFEFESDFM